MGREIFGGHLIRANRLEVSSPLGRLTHGGIIGDIMEQSQHPSHEEDDGQGREHSQDHDREANYRVDLVCRTFVGDSGLRPLATDSIFWESQDIWVEGPTGDPDEAKVGAVNSVKVHIWNLGLAACWGALVDLYWCNPAVGVNAAASHPIGSQEVVLMGGQHKVLSFPWTPVEENGGHECLVAHVYDPLTDPLVAPFNPVLDRHVAQRNVTVISAAPGEKVSLDFYVPNLSASAASSTLQVEQVQGASFELLARGLGQEQLHEASFGEPGLTAPQVREARPVVDLTILPTLSVFREVLEAPPGPSEARTLGTVLRVPVVPSLHERIEPHPEPGGIDFTIPNDVLRRLGSLDVKPAVESPANAEVRPESEEEVPFMRLESLETIISPGLADLGLPEELSSHTVEEGGLPTERELQVESGKELQISLVSSVSQDAAPNSAQVFRVIERVDGRVSGGVTLVVKAR